MQDMQNMMRALEQSGKAALLQQLAESEDGQQLSRMVNAAEVEQAAKSGDQAALQRVLTQVMRSKAGRRLAQQLEEAMQK